MIPNTMISLKPRERVLTRVVPFTETTQKAVNETTDDEISSGLSTNSLSSAFSPILEIFSQNDARNGNAYLSQMSTFSIG